MNFCVNDLEDRNCMFHLCEQVQCIKNLSENLKNIFEGNDIDNDNKINYKQQVATDRTILSCIKSTVNKFIKTAIEMTYELCHQHFIKGLTNFLPMRFKRKSRQQNLYYSDRFCRS